MIVIIAALICLCFIAKDKYIELFSYRSMLIVSFLGYYSFLLFPSYELDLIIARVYIENNLAIYLYASIFFLALIFFRGFQPEVKNISLFSSLLFLIASATTMFLIELTVPLQTSGVTKSDQLENLSNSSSGFSAALLPSLFCFSVILGIYVGKKIFSRSTYYHEFTSATSTYVSIVSFDRSLLIKSLTSKIILFYSILVYIYGVFLVLAVLQQRACILSVMTLLYGLSLSAPRAYLLKVKLPVFLLIYSFCGAFFSVFLILMKPLMAILFLPGRELSLESVVKSIVNRLSSLEPYNLLPLESGVSLMHLNAAFELNAYPSLESMAAKITSFVPFLSDYSPYSSSDIVNQYVSNSLWGLSFNGIADSYVLAGWFGILMSSAILLLPLIPLKLIISPTIKFLFLIPLIYPAIRIYRNSIDFSVGLYRYGFVYLMVSIVLYYVVRLAIGPRTGFKR